MSRASAAGKYYVGLMSGTSMDAVDAALVEFSKERIQLHAYEQFPIAESLKTAIRKLNTQSSIAEVTQYDVILGHLFADAVINLLKQSAIDPNEVIAIGSHGQTILHLPEQPHPRTLQIGDPNIIAQKTGIACAADFRRMDMAAGGEGAPLAPAFHEYAFRALGIDRIVLNIGGIANISVLPGDSNTPIFGFDTGPGNGLLDDWNQCHQNTEMDQDSAWALSGDCHKPLLKQFLTDPYFQLPAPKSTGRDYFNLAWLEKEIIGLEISAVDVQATLFELTWRNIVLAIEQSAPLATELYICGGGARNMPLVEAISAALPNMLVQSTDKLELNPDAIEAVAFAWLAQQRIEEKTANAMPVTGAKASQILGGLYLPACKG